MFPTQPNGAGVPPSSPQRISVTIPGNVYDRLVRLSMEQGRSLSNLCAYLIEMSLRGQERPL